MSYVESAELTVEIVVELYEKHLEALKRVRAEQRASLATGMKAQLDDIEAELTYLRLRECRPESVMEIGSLHGWSTTWILRALRDNGFGRLRTFDIVDGARHHVPAELAEDRWTFVPGDARTTLDQFDVDYLFIDAAHTAGFARWYLTDVLPRLRPGTPVSVHDVFHRARPLPLTEGSVVLKWLASSGITPFTAARAAAPATFERIMRARTRLGLSEPVRHGTANPMIYFRLGGPRHR